ncbi:hypothetical protein [Sutcliffiella rhizosphaerae]|uniref:GNAT family N-acetyltransferase n=1 Tax=Sutcliffiella rhizosphaerae TaxID=2880967 RepID=A0ABN8AC42_9BACI|nr:hypothetical protein [Sutcliffiella rhizosphaerae]CAG9622069.1 hypothetical protein BACCIP111883_02860 [Sutcliffiella rhizosphaerae]
MIRSYYRVKPNISPNVEALKEVLSKWLGDDTFSQQYFLRGLNTKHRLCTYEAYESEKLVGLITAWNSEFHPYCTYFAMVTEAHMGYEIETVLVNALLNVEKIKFPLQTSIWESSYRLKSFYEQSEFLEVRRTYMPSLMVSKVDIEGIFPEFNQQDIYIKDMKSIGNQQELIIQLINLVKKNYEVSHTINPVSVQSFETWKKLIFNKDLIEDGSYIVLKDNEIHAYSLLHYSNTPNKLDFGWRGTKNNNDMRLMLMLTALQINYAEKKGIHTIEAEVDSTDKFSIEMLKFFPFSPTPSLLTFQKLPQDVQL